MFNREDINRFAKKAIADMVDSLNHMAEDPEYNVPSGDITEEIREDSLQYAEDMLQDFQYEVMQAIRTMKFAAERTTTINFEDC